MLRERFIPRLLAAKPEKLLDRDGRLDPSLAYDAMMANEKEGGHGERAGAIGLLDCALWDARAKSERMPLWRVLAERYGMGHDGGVCDVYGTVGHFRPGESLDGLRTEVQRARDAGFRRIKIKLGGTSVKDDCARVDAALSGIGAGEQLAVDMNGHLEPDIAGDWFREMRTRKLWFVEEPAPPLDYALLGSFAAMSESPIATGENLFSWDEGRNLLRYGGLRVGRDLIQIDVSLSYGLTGFMRIVGGFEAACWTRKSFWPHAGHLLAAQVVAGFGLGGHEAAPDPTLPYGGFWDDTRLEGGRLRAPQLPGVGFEGKANLFAVLAPLGNI